MTLENPNFNNFEQKLLHSTLTTQENTATEVMNFIKERFDDRFGDLFLFGRKIKIEAMPNSFNLYDNLSNNNATTIFNMAGMETTDLGIKSRFTLTQIIDDENLGRRVISYRFGEEKAIKTYKNGKGTEEVSDMQEEDFIKADGILKSIGNIFANR
jgi:NAD(P)H-flavin reductase